jgi:hypothetical protein
MLLQYRILAALALSLALLVMTALPVEAREKKSKKRRKNLILVINYPYQITGSASTKIHATLFKPDFVPAKGAKVTVNGKVVCVPDANGTCIFDYVPGSNKNHVLKATLKKGGNTYRVSKSFASNARTASFRSDQLFVYTDRGVYNPGDDILVRIMAWELLADYKALDKAAIKLLLQDKAGRVFAGEELTTNEFGIAASRLPVAENMPEGDYELVVIYQKARETARLRVKRFVPPVMSIRHDIKRFLTPAQESLKIVAKLSYFAGGIPQGAELTLKVKASDGKDLLDKLFEADKVGQFELTLAKSDLDKIRKATAAEQPFKMELEATDKFKRTSKVTRDVVYTERPYRAVLEFDKDDYPPGELVKLQAKVVDLDGKPAREIKLTCTVAEFKVKAEAVTDKMGVAEFSFKMGKSAGTAVVTSPVMKVPLGQKAVRLNSPKPMTSKVFDPPAKQGVQTRMTVTFDKRYRPVEKVVHVDFTDLSGGLLVSTTIPVSEKDGVFTAEGTITAPSWGTMLANLYVCAVEKKKVKKGGRLSTKNVGFITEGQHVTLHPDATAEIRFEGLKPRVKPGEKLMVTVDVKNPKGGDSVVGAMMVDDAVISLLDPLEVTPGDHFYNPQRKVISTGGAGVLTWPVVDRNWGEPWRDIAYTNWGFKGPGSMTTEGGDEGEMAGEGGLGMKGTGSGGGGSSSGVVMGSIGSAKGGASFGAKKSPKKAKMMMSKMVMADPAPAMEMEEAMDEDASIDGDLRRRSRNGGSKAAKPPRQITIRTRFPETAMWEPILKTKSGKTTFRVQFPDAITIQRLTVVSSGKQGGLGMKHQNIEVRQDLFVQADVPATLTSGDEVSIVTVVQNHSGGDAVVKVVPTASGLELLDTAPQLLSLEAGESGAAVFKVRASYVGEVEFAVSAGNSDFSDEERRKFRILPAGEPVMTDLRGRVEAGKPFIGKVVLQEGAVHSSAHLSVAFPNSIPAIQAWQAMAEFPMAFVGVTGVASRAILDAALLEHARRINLPRERRKALEGRLRRAGAELVSAQNDDGSWGWFYHADASSDGGYVISVYLSAYALKALVEIAEADLLHNQSAIKKGAEFLLESRNNKGLWSPTAYFWEVNAPETDWGLSGDLFETVVRAHRLTEKKPNKPLLSLHSKFKTYLDGRPDDPAGVAHALGAMVVWNKWRKSKSDSKKIEEWVNYLLSLKRQGHWEPHWYHAYGGMVELNARILELLQGIEGEGFPAVQYEIVSWLLSTREAWGAWHNEIGTANAVKALLGAGAGAKPEKASTVTIVVNGTAVKSVAIRPDDVFLSAAPLRFVDITSYLQDGDNKVEVEYDGNLVAPVAVELRQWPVRRKVAKGKDAVLTIAREVAAEGALGEPLTVELTVASSKTVPYVEILESVPSTVAVDKRSLDELVDSGAIQGYQIVDGQVALFMHKLDGETKLSYRVLATREGTGHHGGTRVVARFHQEFGVARFIGGPITVN